MNRKSFLLKYIIIAIISLIIIVPFYQMIVNSFKSADESYRPNLAPPIEWQVLENYSTVWEKGNLTSGIINSIIITFSSTIIILITSTSAAFVFGRRKNKAIKVIFFIFLMGLMTPPSIILTVYVLKYFNLLGTYIGIILFYAATFSPFPTFLITGFMATVPIEIEESAVIDGASPIKVFLKIVVPLLKPAILTSLIWVFLKIWNDFIYPMFILSGETDKYTMILGLFAFRGRYYTQWNLVFSHLLLVSMPVIVVFLFAQKQITEGLTAGAIKG